MLIHFPRNLNLILSKHAHATENKVAPLLTYYGLTARNLIKPERVRRASLRKLIISEKLPFATFPMRLNHSNSSVFLILRVLRASA